MLPKTIICYVLKCLNSGKVKAETLGRLLNSFVMHLHVEFEIMEGVLDHPEKGLYTENSLNFGGIREVVKLTGHNLHKVS